MIKKNRCSQSRTLSRTPNSVAVGTGVQQVVARFACSASLLVGITFAMPSLAQTVPDNTRHGTNGATTVPGAFQLAGQKADYIVEQMRAFKDGKKSATIMHQIAKGYSDEQVIALANYFSKQPKAK
jgi:cytochrome c553